MSDRQTQKRPAQNEVFIFVAGIGPGGVEVAVPEWYADGLLWELWCGIAECNQNTPPQQRAAEKRVLELGYEWPVKHSSKP